MRIPLIQKSTLHRLLGEMGEADTVFKGIAEITLASSQVFHVTFLTATEAIVFHFLRENSEVSPRLNATARLIQ